MRIDLSYKVDKKMLETLGLASKEVRQDMDKTGHIGTHFDVMNREYSIDNIITKGRIFDISDIKTGEVRSSDLDLSTVEEKDFVIFYTGILKEYGYGTKEYFINYIELSDELIDKLIDKKVSYIGVDMGGAKAPKDHPRIDQYCADKGVFIIENLNNLELLLEKAHNKPFTVYNFPVNFEGFSGIPCRVVAELE